MSYEVYKKLIKEDLKQAIESGTLNEEQCISMIDAAIRNLASIDNPTINKAIEEFITTVGTKIKELTQISKDISKEYKEMYEDIIKNM